MSVDGLKVLEASTLEQRLQVLSREIGAAKRRGDDPSGLIAQHQALQEQLRREQPPPPERIGPAVPTLRVISSPQELQALQPQYDALLEASTAVSPFLLLEWLLPWYDHFGRDYDVHAAVVEHEDRLLAAAMLMVGEEKRLGRQPVARFLGTGPGLRGNYFSFVMDPKTPDATGLLRAHVRELLDQGRLLHLEHLSPYADGRDTLAMLASEPDQELLIRGESGCVRGSLPDRYSEFVRSVPSPQRRNKLRCGDDRVCRHQGSLTYADCAGAEEVSQHLDLLRQFSAERREREGIESTWCDDTNHSCRTEAARRMLQRGALRLESIVCGPDEIGALAGFVFKNRYFCYNMGFNQSFARYEPGHLLVARRIKASIEEGLREFDFLVGDAQYKRQYFRDVTPELQVTALPHKGRARLAETVRLLARSLRRAAVKT